MEIIVLIAIAVFVIWLFISKYKDEIKEKDEIKKRLFEEIRKNEEIEIKYEKIKQKENKINELIQKEQAIRDNFHNKVMEIFNKNLVEKSKSFRWVAGLISDLSIIAENEYVNQLNRSYSVDKKQRAIKITNLKDEKKKLIEENKILKYEIEYIKSIIPVSEEVFEYDDIGITYDDFEYYHNYLTKEEYLALPDIEKNKKALEYYKKRKKTNWEIGCDFERYVGYCYEQKGYSVDYFGIDMKLEDLGRDLVVTNDDEILIVQCKYWSINKIIHEKHIAQLFGTTKKYELEYSGNKKINCIFITHTQISEEAKNFCEALNVRYRENVEIGDFPIIKCHNSKDEYGNPTKIYHLPMDQQYDKTKIDKRKGDFYAATIEEAEQRGFRRAYKWHPYN